MLFVPNSASLAVASAGCTHSNVSVSNVLLTHCVCVADNVCLRPWAFERVPNKMIRGLDNALIYTSTKEACLAACLNEVCGSCTCQ
jgi:hypothetical protein